MNNQPRDLVLKAIQHQETDFCPYVIWVKERKFKNQAGRALPGPEYF